MSFPVVLKRLAQAEYDDAVDWLEKRWRGQGVKFAAAVRQVFADLSLNPDRYPEVRDDTREAPVSGFTYAVYYRMEPHRVVVIAAFHTSRDPTEWHRRT